MEALIESMTKLVVHPVKNKPWKEFSIRMWRQELAFSDCLCGTTREEALKVILDSKTEEKMAIATLLLKMDRMNAVEVLDETSNGCVMYKDWP